MTVQTGMTLQTTRHTELGSAADYAFYSSVIAGMTTLDSSASISPSSVGRFTTGILIKLCFPFIQIGVNLKRCGQSD